jgi:hypothetical protein
MGESEMARALLAAAPPSAELTVMPELFPDEASKLAELYQTPEHALDLPEAMRRARAILVDEVAAPVDAPDSGSSTTASLSRDGDGWAVTFAGRPARVRHLKGVSDLAILVARPGVEVHCLELMGGADVSAGTGAQLDERARREYSTRIEELQSDIDDAHASNDPARAERAELELDALVEQLSEAFGLGGRARTSGSSAERARSAVTYRVRSAIRRLGEVHPELGRHLDNAVRTGVWCSYRPETDVTWAVSLG